MPKTEPFDKYLNEYEQWFKDNSYLFESELIAIKKVIPVKGAGVEIGVGSGVFAGKLGITEGIEPSEKMREKAQSRNLSVKNAVAEDLPYPDKSKDFALMVTVICFVDDIQKSFREANRILKNDGNLIVAFIDKDSPVGKIYEKNKHQSVFYEDATFFGTEQVVDILQQTGFKIDKIYQTIYGDIGKISSAQKPLEGYGQGSFVVIKANKEWRRNET